jgi:tetratricopeptide (TPR) repeat protein
MPGKGNGIRNDAPAPDRLAQPATPLQTLGPLTEAGREARSVLTHQDAIRRSPAQRGSAPAVPAGSDALPASRRRAAAAVHLRVGSTMLAAGKPAEAIGAFRKAIEIDPENPVVHHDLGLACLRSARITDAIAAFHQAIALKEEYASAYFNLGQALEENREEVVAIAAYRHAVSIAPNFVEAHERLGSLLDKNASPAEALASFERAAGAKPSSTLGRLARAEALKIRGRLADAETWFGRAIAGDPNNGYARRAFGIFLTHAGRLEEAADCLGRALARDPTDVMAFFNLANAKKFAETDAPLLARMLALLEAGGLGDNQMEALHFALGKAFGDLGDCETAMRHFDAANRLVRRSGTFDRRKFAVRVDRIIARFGADALPGRTGSGSDDRTPILIVGMPRSGTTLVEQILSSHRAVVAGGELAFWAQQGAFWEAAMADGAVPASPDQLAGQYRAVLRAKSPDASRITDKLPANFYWIGLFRRSFPNAAIIHCRRHPVDTCLSIYSNRLWGYYGNDRADLVFSYRQYQRLMAHWRSLLPPDLFLEVDYEALVANREAVTRQMIAFLGLEWDEACLAPERNARLVITASMWQVRQPVYSSSVERWRRYEPWLGEFRELMPEPAADPSAPPAPPAIRMAEGLSARP